MLRILVANRGEIALRIMRTCRRAEIETVAVYSEPDAGSAHMRAADFAGAFGPGVCAVKLSRHRQADRGGPSDAMHPGYRFLSENAAFARQVVDAGLIWIGPRPDTIVAIGDKARARGIAMAADVPVLPATSRFAEVTPSFREATEAIGYPLRMIVCHFGILSLLASHRGCRNWAMTSSVRAAGACAARTDRSRSTEATGRSGDTRRRAARRGQRRRPT
jgi:acetyl/propionyl-CoA carboxylase alpha subunit